MGRAGNIGMEFRMGRFRQLPINCHLRRKSPLVFSVLRSPAVPPTVLSYLTFARFLEASTRFMFLFPEGGLPIFELSISFDDQCLLAASFKRSYVILEDIRKRLVVDSTATDSLSGFLFLTRPMSSFNHGSLGMA